jgi:tetratricopeptide (TPR) repeat protein
VSIDEVYRFLRGWLGHETHITGEVYRTTNGIAVTARAGVTNAATYAGSEADLDTLVQKAAEYVYKNTQPFRYAIYLDRRPVANGMRFLADDAEEARQIYVGLTNDPDPSERALAWNGLAILDSNVFGNARSAASDARRAISENPDLTSAYINLSNYEVVLGHTEAALAASQNFLRLISREPVPDIDKHSIAGFRLEAGIYVARLLGDFTNAISLARSGVELTDPDAFIGQETFRQYEVDALAQQHDKIGTVVYLRSLPPLVSGNRVTTIFYAHAYLEDWQAVVASEKSTEKQYAEANSAGDLKAIFANRLRPYFALAKAKLGDTAGAEAVIATTPSDCYDCIRMRGNIAAVEGNWGRADYWFARAVQAAPSTWPARDWCRAASSGAVAVNFWVN